MDKKALSLPILISLVVGNMIGTGIYILPSSLAEFGTISLLAWIYTSIGALLIAITFGRLSKRFPKTGGPYIFCREAFGKLTGFIVAYTYWLSNLVAIAGLAVASVGYLGFFTPVLNANNVNYSPHIVLLVELAVIWGFTAINIIGLHTAGLVQFWLTVLKILPLIAIAIVGLGSVHISNLSHFTGGNAPFNAFNNAAMLTFWAFIGIEAATVPAESTKGPNDVFKATVWGTALTALIYICSSMVLMGMIPMAELKTSQFPFAEAGTILFGAYAALFVTFCAFASGVGSLNGCMLIQGQIMFAAARDHLFPRSLAKLSKHDVPVKGQIFSAALISVLLILTINPSLLKQFNDIALLAVLLTLLTYLATMLAELKFLVQSKKAAGKAIIVPFLAALYSFWTISNFDKIYIVVGFGLILCCIPIYFFTVRRYANS